MKTRRLHEMLKGISVLYTVVTVEVSFSAPHTARNTDNFWSVDAVDGFVLA